MKGDSFLVPKTKAPHHNNSMVHTYVPSKVHIYKYKYSYKKFYN